MQYSTRGGSKSRVLYEASNPTPRSIYFPYSTSMTVVEKEMATKENFTSMK